MRRRGECMEGGFPLCKAKTKNTETFISQANQSMNSFSPNKRTCALIQFSPVSNRQKSKEYKQKFASSRSQQKLEASERRMFFSFFFQGEREITKTVSFQLFFFLQLLSGVRPGGPTCIKQAGGRATMCS